MGNQSLPSNNDFDKTHPNFDKLFTKNQNDKYIDKIKFRQLFYPLTSDSIPFENLFNIYANKQGKITKSKIIKLLSLFFEQNGADNIEQIKSLIFSKNVNNKIDKNKYEYEINRLFNHKIDSEIKNFLLDCFPNIFQSNSKNNIYPPNPNIFPLAKEEIKNFNIYEQRNYCLIFRCDCSKKKDILPCKIEIEFEKLTCREFKKIQKENNSKFPIKILHSLFEKYNYSDPELTEIIIKYLKRYTLSNYIDFTRFSSFFNLFITKSKGKFEDILDLVKTISFYKAPEKEIIKNKRLLVTRQLPIKKTNIGSKKDLFNIDPNEYISKNITTALISVSSIPTVKFHYDFYDEPIICNYIFNIFQIFSIKEYQKAIFKRNDSFYFIDKNHFQLILDLIQSNNSSRLKDCLITFKNLLDGDMPRLKKEISIDQIMLLDKILFTYIKILTLTEPGELGQYAKLKKIKYELNETDRLPEHTMFEKDGNIIYELELYPICVIAYSFKEEYNSKKGLKNIKEIVSSVDVNNNNTESFSRKNTIKEVIETFNKNRWCESFSLIKPITYYMYTNEEQFFQIENMEQTLEEIKSDKIFLLFDSINPEFNHEITYYQSLNENVNVNEKNECSKQIQMDTPQSINETMNDYSNIPLKFSNRDNLCFLNSVFQLLINLPLFKDYLLSFDEQFIIKYLSFSNKGIFAKALLETLKIRWSNNKNRKTKLYNFKEFTKILDLLTKQFDSFQQQDANEFLNYILEELKEEFNLLYSKELFTTPFENEYIIHVSNSIRNSPSIIKAMFSFDLKVELTCTGCNMKRTNYELHNSLFLAIPTPQKTRFCVYLYKLPFWLKLYYNKINTSFETNLNQTKNKTYIESLDEYLYSNIIEEDDLDIKTGLTPIYMEYTFDKEKRISELINEIKYNKNLELEKDNELTTFFVYGKSPEDKFNEKEATYYEEKLTIDQCIQNQQDVYIYETLNLKGLKMLDKIESKKIEDIIITNNNEFQEDETEFKIVIKHYTLKSNSEDYIREHRREPLPFKSEVIFLKNNFIYGITLYKLIWLKFRKYFKPLREQAFWWENIRYSNSSSLMCYPFTIKIMEETKIKNVLNCPNCGWWRFCTGCVLNPKKKVYVPNINNSIIVVDWCYSVWSKEIIREQIKNVIAYNKNNNILNTIEPEVSLQQCLDNYLEKEKLDDKLKCYYCNKCTSFTKQYLFNEIMPPILIITLNRFKYSTKYSNKITTFVNYPLNDLKINNDYYDLYGVSNHIGTLNNGHYTTIIKNNNEWISFYDTNYEIIPKEKVVNQQAYILVYINKKAKENHFLNLISDIMKQMNDKNTLKDTKHNDTKEEYKIYPSQFYKGEPINYKNNKGCYLEEINATHSLIILDNNKETVETKEIEHDIFYIYNIDNVINVNNNDTPIGYTPYDKENCLIY